MKATSIEHANITVPDIDVALKFLKIVAPDFIIRKDKKPEGSYRWAHMAMITSMIALQEPHLQKEPTVGSTAYENSGVNHLALIVSDLDSIEEALIEAGYKKVLRLLKKNLENASIIMTMKDLKGSLSNIYPINLKSDIYTNNKDVS